VGPDPGPGLNMCTSVVDPKRLCSDQDSGSHVHSDPAPSRIRINSDSDPDPT